MTIDATFWVAISFFIFLGILIYLQIPLKINSSLTNQINEIKKELYEAEKLKVEAKNLLSDYEDKIDKSKKEGLSKSEVLDNVFNHPDFAFPRVQRIATTEATKTINDAIAKSAEQGSRDGVQLMKQWISQQDNRVRPAHVFFASQGPIPTGEKWIWEDEQGSQQAEYPGGFESDDLTVNCRCTFESIVMTAEGEEITIE